jgi:ribosomal protein L37AE/L43A
MDTPVRPEDLKVVQGHSGQGLQYVCPSCGCINWNHLDMPEAIWACRNCGRVFTYDFPLLVEQFRALEKTASEAPAGTPAS